MPLTVITITNAPRSLRGDLTKWMQEISTGVYVANINSKVREQLWDRIIQTIDNGEATMTYRAQNEIGYDFEIHNSTTKKIDFDGIPLVMIPNKVKNNMPNSQIKYGFSDASKYRKARKYSSNNQKNLKPYVVLDIETSGLNTENDEIIEIAMIKEENDNKQSFKRLIQTSTQLSYEITKLTGITNRLLNEEGYPIEEVLKEAIQFIGDLPIIGFNLNFDIKMINSKLKTIGENPLNNKTIDLLPFVKKEKQFLNRYRLDDVLEAYDIEFEKRHRALIDAELTWKLSKKVNKFVKQFKV